VILDTSAILAVLLRELGCEGLLRHIAEAQMVGVGAPTVVETAMVLSARIRKNSRVLLNEFLREAEVEIIPFTRDHYEIAVDAFERHGKGRYSAALNFRLDDLQGPPKPHLARAPLLIVCVPIPIHQPGIS